MTHMNFKKMKDFLVMMKSLFSNVSKNSVMKRKIELEKCSMPSNWVVIHSVEV